MAIRPRFRRGHDQWRRGRGAVLADAGFSKAFSDPYYAAFVRAWGRRHSELMAGQQVLSKEQLQEVDRVAGEVLKEALAEVEKDVAS